MGKEHEGNDIGRAHFQGGRGVVALAAVFKQGFVDHNHNYFLGASLDWVSSPSPSSSHKALSTMSTTSTSTMAVLTRATSPTSSSVGLPLGTTTALALLKSTPASANIDCKNGTRAGSGWRRLEVKPHFKKGGMSGPGPVHGPGPSGNL
jgi:hypothetical protein